MLGDLFLFDYLFLPIMWFLCWKDGLKCGFFEYVYFMGFGGPKPAGLFPPPKTRWDKVAENAFMR